MTVWKRQRIGIENRSCQGLEVEGEADNKRTERRIFEVDKMFYVTVGTVNTQFSEYDHMHENVHHRG